MRDEETTMTPQPIGSAKVSMQDEGDLLAVLPPFETTRDLLLAVHRAQEEKRPILGVQINLEDRPRVETLIDTRFLTIDDMADTLGITTEGRLFCGIRPEGHMDLPVEVAELTGNVEERELAARYIDAKIAGVDHHIMHATNPAYIEAYEHCGIVLKCIAKEFRMGMHLPDVRAPEARIIPYNETNDTGIKHETALRAFFSDVHERNVKAGWWSEITTGEPKKRSVGELLILMVTEMAEAYSAWLVGSADDKLPQFPGLGVEMADLLIRAADFCGALQAGRIVAPSGVYNPGDEMFREIVAIANRYEAIRKTPEAIGAKEEGDFIEPQDVAQMTDAKLAFNAQRPDHKIEARLAEDGKRT